MARLWGLRPRQAWRQAMGLSQDDVALAFNDISGDPRSPMSGKRISDFEVWPYGGARPSAYVLVTLGRLFGCHATELLDLVDRQRMPSGDLAVLQANGQPSATPALGTTALPVIHSRVGGRHPGEHLGHGRQPDKRSLESLNKLRETVMAAADESTTHAAAAEATHIVGSTLEELDHDIRRVAASFLNGDLIEQFSQAVRIRRRVYRYLDASRYPEQSSELYRLAAELSCLLADASNNLGFPGAAVEQTRSAWTYAEIIGHDGIKAWCRSNQSLLAMRVDRPKQAASLAESGLKFARTPIAQALLHSRAALALAHLGDITGTMTALTAARQAQERAGGHDELFDDVGGMFAFPIAKQSYLAASTLIAADEPELAAQEAEQAIHLYTTGPPDERAQGCEASARIDLATSFLIRQQLDGANHALGAVLDVPPNRRVDWLIPRLATFRAHLERPPFSNSYNARRLIERIEDYEDGMISKNLPGTMT